MAQVGPRGRAIWLRGLGVGRRWRGRFGDRRFGFRAGGVSGGRKLFGARSSTDSQPTGGPSMMGVKSISAVSKPSPQSMIGSGGSRRSWPAAGRCRRPRSSCRARTGPAAGWVRRRRSGCRRPLVASMSSSACRLVSSLGLLQRASPWGPIRPATCWAMSIVTPDSKLAQLALSRSPPPSRRSPLQTALEMKRSSPAPAWSWSAPPLFGSASSRPAAFTVSSPAPSTRASSVSPPVR